jgi:hypothetical protein
MGVWGTVYEMDKHNLWFKREQYKSVGTKTIF